jgi:hypothetical protein
MPLYDANGNELVAGPAPQVVVQQMLGGARRAPAPGRKPQLIQLASLTASALVAAPPTGASSPSAGPIQPVGQYLEALLWAVIVGGTGTPAGLQFGLQIADQYNGVYALHPSGLSAASTATSGVLGVIAATQLGVAVRAICIATTAPTAGTITIWGAFKV